MPPPPSFSDNVIVGDCLVNHSWREGIESQAMLRTNLSTGLVWGWFGFVQGTRSRRVVG
jgi:hypothetical protein